MVICANLAAIFDEYEPSPRARGMGGAFIAISDDQMAVFYNPAGLSEVGSGVTAAYTRVFGNEFQLLNAIGFSYELPGRFGTFGLGLESLNVDYLEINLMSEKTYNISHAILLLDGLNKISLGYSLNIFSLDMDSFGNETALGIDLGLLTVLQEHLRAGFTVRNLNSPGFGEGGQEKLAQKIEAGIAYYPYQDVVTALELKKNYGSGGIEADKTEFHFGTEYKVHELLTLRCGVSNYPVSFSLGAGFNLLDMVLDYGYNTHLVLGSTHHFGLKYKF